MGEHASTGARTLADRVADATTYGYIELPAFSDDRGLLAVAEPGTTLPFVPVRVFTISNVPSGMTRAEHANRSCSEVLICSAGSCVVLVDDGTTEATFHLDRPDIGLSLPAGLWVTCRDFSADAVLLVLASAPYDPTNQINDYADYLDFVAASR